MRVAFVVDGFNLYHSIRDAERHVAARPQRWLDLRAFCADYVRHFGRAAVLEGVYYFSALARHLEASNPDVVLRHRRYIDALEGSGVRVSLASFKVRDVHAPLRDCAIRVGRLRRPVRLPIPGCRVVLRRGEEKETDVAIASKLFELLHTNAADAVVLVSGDTDLLPAIRTAQRLFPTSTVAVLFPFRRHNAELKGAVRRSFRVRKEQYARFQFPDPVALPGGREVQKPLRW